MFIVKYAILILEKLSNSNKILNKNIYPYTNYFKNLCLYFYFDWYFKKLLLLTFIILTFMSWLNRMCLKSIDKDNI